MFEGEGPSLCGRDWILHSKLNLWGMNMNKTLKKDDLCINSLGLDSLLNKHKLIFNDELGTFNGPKVHLWLKDGAKPNFAPARQVPYSLRDKVSEEIDRLIKKGVLTPVSFSRYASPVVIKLKKDQSVRLCGDFKTTVNPNIDIECYPLPKIESIFAKLSGGVNFTKLDMKDAYCQLELDEESKEIVVINTQKGLYKFNRLPFGISSSPALFQRVMDNLLKGIPMVESFQDDIIVTGRDDDEHLKSLEMVLTRLETAGLKLKKNKCEFMLPSVTYLGYKIDNQGLHPLQTRLEAIKDAPTPETIEMLKAFIGTINYYGKFIKNQSSIFAPLYKLLRKDQKWIWGIEQDEAFKAAKNAICDSSLLVHYDPEKELILACDASPYGVGAVLSHPGENKEESDRPIAFASRTLTNAEKGYSQIEKEALALVFGVTRFRDYLIGHRFTLQTDHQPLVSLLSEKKQIPRVAAARIQRWALTLSAYSYTLRYRKGKLHANADGLSRLPLPNVETETPNLNELVLLLKEENIVAKNCSQKCLKKETSDNLLLQKVMTYVKDGWPKHEKDCINHEQMKYYFKKRNDITCENGILLWGQRVIVPDSLKLSVINELHDTHQGMSLMKLLAREKVWWPCIDNDLEQCVACCTVCQETADMPSQNVYIPWPSATQPWEKIHVDYAGPVDGNMILIVIDSHTKWLEAIVVRSATAQSTVNELRKLFSRYGLPYTLVSDNGTHFSAGVVDEFLEKNGVKHIYIAPYHPRSNGQAERAVRIVKKGLEKLKLSLIEKLGNEEGELHVRLERVLMNYRRTPVTSTGISPAESFMGRKMRTRLDLLKPRPKTEEGEEDGTKDDWNSVGTHVWVKNYGKGKNWKNGKIVDKIGKTMVMIQTEDGVVNRHRDQIRKNHMVTFEQESNVNQECREAKLDSSKQNVVCTRSEIEKITVGNGNHKDENGVNLNMETDTTLKVDRPLDAVKDESSVLRRSSRLKKPVVKLNL